MIYYILLLYYILLNNNTHYTLRGLHPFAVCLQRVIWKMTCTCLSYDALPKINLIPSATPPLACTILPGLMFQSCNLGKSNICCPVQHRVAKLLQSFWLLPLNFHLPLSFGSNSASSSALVGSTSAAAAAAAAAALAATALEAPLLVAVLVSDFFMVSLTLWPRKTAWIFVAAFAAIKRKGKETLKVLCNGNIYRKYMEDVPAKSWPTSLIFNKWHSANLCCEELFDSLATPTPPSCCLAITFAKQLTCRTNSRAKKSIDRSLIEPTKCGVEFLGSLPAHKLRQRPLLINLKRNFCACLGSTRAPYAINGSKLNIVDATRPCTYPVHSQNWDWEQVDSIRDSAWHNLPHIIYLVEVRGNESAAK